MAVNVATLVTSASPTMVFTTEHSCDARRALLRGLADYLRTFKGIILEGGRELALQRIDIDWADTTKQAEYPSAYVSTVDRCNYDASGLTPAVAAADKIPNTNLYVVCSSELVVSIKFELWCTDKQERAGLVALFEDFLNPNVTTYGFALTLPYYYGQRAQYSLESQEVVDTEIDAVQRYRKASFYITAQVPVTRLVDLPSARIIVKLEVDEEVVVE